MSPNLSDLQARARSIRGKVVEMSHRAETPHLGSSLSCVDILVAAYWGALKVDPARPDDPLRDRLILSKGHAVSALYATLSARGYFPDDWLASFNVPGGRLPEQPSPGCVPGVELATGSLGHGLPVGSGMALAGKLRDQTYRVVVLMSDGECNEGSVWEAAMFAPARGLDNLAVVIDYNKWQATGRSNEVFRLDPLKDKWLAAGWSAHEVDGHDLSKLVDLLSRVPDGSGRPVAIIANTVKGKGVSFMEDNNDWHYRPPTDADLQNARKELGLL
jgi:transketolase